MEAVALIPLVTLVIVVILIVAAVALDDYLERRAGAKARVRGKTRT